MSTRDGKFAAYHNVPFLLVDVSLRLVLLCEAGSTLQPMRMLAARSPIPPHSSLITMKIHETTPCHNLT